MKSKVVLPLIILLFAALTCLGLGACGADVALLPGDTEIPDETTEESPAPNEEIHKVEDTYRDEIAAITIELNTAFFSLDELLLSPEFENDDWISEVSLSTSDIITLCEAAGEIVPPESMTNAHVAYLEAIMHFNDAMAILFRGIDEANTDLINQASAEMWLASEIMTEFSDLPE